MQPPIQVFGTEGRYATALYSAATKKKALDTVEKDLKTFQATLKKDARLADFLADPSIKKSLKADGLSGACDKLKMNELSKNLFLALAENGRFNMAESVAAAFSTIMAAHRGEVVCEITTAKVIIWLANDRDAGTGQTGLEELHLREERNSWISGPTCCIHSSKFQGFLL